MNPRTDVKNRWTVTSIKLESNDYFELTVSLTSYLGENGDWVSYPERIPLTGRIYFTYNDKKTGEEKPSGDYLGFVKETGWNGTDPDYLVDIRNFSGTYESWIKGRNTEAKTLDSGRVVPAKTFFSISFYEPKERKLDAKARGILSDKLKAIAPAQTPRPLNAAPIADDFTKNKQAFLAKWRKAFPNIDDNNLKDELRAWVETVLGEGYMASGKIKDQNDLDKLNSELDAQVETFNNGVPADPKSIPF